MRPFFYLSLGLVVLSCASPGELQKKKPLVSYETAKKPSEVKDCLLKSWMEVRSGVSSHETSKEFMIVLHDGFVNRTLAMATVSKEDPVKVSYHKQAFFIDSLAEPTRRCK